MSEADSILLERLSRALDLTNGLSASLSDELLTRHNGEAPSNDIGSQFWCLVGARESYSQAIESGAWAGFSCTLSGKDARRLEPLEAALERSRATVLAGVARELDAPREQLVFDLLEHEVQHQGQLIRYFYANRIPFPEAFAGRYHLAQPKA